MYQVSQQETPEHRAIEAYDRAARSIKKAEGTKDPEKRRKLYETAKDELHRSLALKSTFDSLLALGRVDLALGDLPAALTACAQAESLKPKNAAATACERGSHRSRGRSSRRRSDPPTPGSSAASDRRLRAAGSPPPRSGRWLCLLALMTS